MPQASPCGMPSAGFHRNGTLFVVCGNGHYLVATDSWKDGAWRFVTKLVPPPKWEDPTMWWDARGHWHIIYHVWAADPFAKHHEPASGHAYRLHPCSTHAISVAIGIRQHSGRTGVSHTIDQCLLVLIGRGLAGAGTAVTAWRGSSAWSSRSQAVAFSSGRGSQQFATRERPHLLFADANRSMPNGLTSTVSSQPLGPGCDSCTMGACSQCKVTKGRDWTYTIYQPLGWGRTDMD